MRFYRVKVPLSEFILMKKLDDIDKSIIRLKHKVGVELDEIRIELGVATRFIESKLVHTIIPRSSALIKLKSGEFKCVNGAFLVQSGAVCVRMDGDNKASSFVCKGDVAFVPYDFHLFSPIDSEMQGIVPTSANYDSYISDQLCFARNMSDGRVIDRLRWILRRIVATSSSNNIKIKKTAFCHALGITRDWLTKTMAELVDEGFLSRENKSGNYRLT